AFDFLEAILSQTVTAKVYGTLAEMLVNFTQNPEGNAINPNVQMDVDEFFNQTMDRLEHELQHTTLAADIGRPFAGQFIQQIKSLDPKCQHVSKSFQSFHTISVDVKNAHNLAKSLEVFVAGEHLDGDNKYDTKKLFKDGKEISLSLPRTRSAYMLFYEKDGFLEPQTSNHTPPVVPLEIATAVDEDNRNLQADVLLYDSSFCGAMYHIARVAAANVARNDPVYIKILRLLYQVLFKGVIRVAERMDELSPDTPSEAMATSVLIVTTLLQEVLSDRTTYISELVLLLIKIVTLLMNYLNAGDLTKVFKSEFQKRLNRNGELRVSESPHRSVECLTPLIRRLVLSLDETTLNSEADVDKREHCSANLSEIVDTGRENTDWTEWKHTENQKVLDLQLTVLSEKAEQGTPPIVALTKAFKSHIGYIIREMVIGSSYNGKNGATVIQNLFGANHAQADNDSDSSQFITTSLLSESKAMLAAVMKAEQISRSRNTSGSLATGLVTYAHLLYIFTSSNNVSVMLDDDIDRVAQAIQKAQMLPHLSLDFAQPSEAFLATSIVPNLLQILFTEMARPSAGKIDSISEKSEQMHRIISLLNVYLCGYLLGSPDHGPASTSHIQTMLHFAPVLLRNELFQSELRKLGALPAQFEIWLLPIWMSITRASLDDGEYAMKFLFNTVAFWTSKQIDHGGAKESSHHYVICARRLSGEVLLLAANNLDAMEASQRSTTTRRLELYHAMLGSILRVIVSKMAPLEQIARALNLVFHIAAPLIPHNTRILDYLKNMVDRFLDASRNTVPHPPPFDIQYVRMLITKLTSYGEQPSGVLWRNYLGEVARLMSKYMQDVDRHRCMDVFCKSVEDLGNRAQDEEFDRNFHDGLLGRIQTLKKAVILLVALAERGELAVDEQFYSAVREFEAIFSSYIGHVLEEKGNNGAPNASRLATHTEAMGSDDVSPLWAPQQTVDLAQKVFDLVRRLKVLLDTAAEEIAIGEEELDGGGGDGDEEDAVVVDTPDTALGRVELPVRTERNDVQDPHGCADVSHHHVKPDINMDWPCEGEEEDDAFWQQAAKVADDIEKEHKFGEPILGEVILLTLSHYKQVVCVREGYSRGTALSIAKAIASDYSQTKGKSLGIISNNPTSKEAAFEQKKYQDAVIVSANALQYPAFGSAVWCIETRDGLRAFDIPKAMSLDSRGVERYLDSAFGKRKDETEQVLRELAEVCDCALLANILRDAGYADVKVHPTTLVNYESILGTIKSEIDSIEVNGSTSGFNSVVVLNLCDGTETDGYPGPSVLTLLNRFHIPHTGSDPVFYEISTSKPKIKRCLQSCGVPTSPFVEIDPGSVGTDEKLTTDIAKAVELVGFPLIVKPSFGYASLGIGPHSVCFSADSIQDAVRITRKLTFDEHTFAERFLDGREFTVLLVGTPPDPVVVYRPAERVFSSELEGPDRMLQFDRYWKTDAGSFYTYVNLSSEEHLLEEHIVRIAKEAYAACGGSGYGRVDLRTTSRQEKDGWEVLVLEVNANPSLAFDPLMSTSGAILHLATEPAAEFLHRIVKDAKSRATLAMKVNGLSCRPAIEIDDFR
ncbi:hypothetical protein HDU93_006726, partial [Gonapodya sp. JEL0774]